MAALQLKTQAFPSDDVVFPGSTSRRHMFVVNTGTGDLTMSMSPAGQPDLANGYPIPPGGHREIQYGSASNIRLSGSEFVFESDIIPTGKQLAKYLHLLTEGATYTGLTPATDIVVSLNDCSFTSEVAGLNIPNASEETFLLCESGPRSVALTDSLRTVLVRNSAVGLDVEIPLEGVRYGDLIGRTTASGLVSFTVTLKRKAGNQLYAEVAINGAFAAAGQVHTPAISDYGTISVGNILGTTSGADGNYIGKYSKVGIVTGGVTVLECPMIEANGINQLSTTGPNLTITGTDGVAFDWEQVYDWSK